MINLLHIVEGWAKSYGLLEVTDQAATMSSERMKICATCDEAKESKFLMLLKDEGHEMASIYCRLCKCPVNEKSLVAGEKCPLKKWEISNQIN